MCFLLSRYRPLPASQALDQSLAPALPKHIFPVPVREPSLGQGGSGRREEPRLCPGTARSHAKAVGEAVRGRMLARGSPSPASPRYLASGGVRRGQGQGRGRRRTRCPAGWARRNEPGRGRRWDGGGQRPPFPVHDSYSNGLPAERDGGLQATGMSLPIPSAWRPPPPARPPVEAKPARRRQPGHAPAPGRHGGPRRRTKGRLVGQRASGAAFPGLPARHSRNAAAATRGEARGAAWRDGRPMLWEPAGAAVQGATAPFFAPSGDAPWWRHQHG